MAPTSERTFPLTRYFVITSFLTILLITAATNYVSSHRIQRDLLEEAKDHAVRVIRHLQQDIFSDFIRPRMARGEAIDLAERGQQEELDAIVRRVADGFLIQSIYIFDTEGTILYSTTAEHVGFQTPPSNDLYWHALGGEIRSEVRERGAPLDLAGSGASVPLLETYVPVSSLAAAENEGGPITNVIETYQDLRRFESDLRSTQTRVSLYAFLGGTILFAVLFGIIRLADRIIRDRGRDLTRSNEQLRELSRHLEDEVEKRSRELIQKEKLASLGTFSAGLAHEVNNPLATIASCAQGLDRRVSEFKETGELEVEDFDSYLSLIREEAFRVKRITSSLLDFSRQQMSDRIERTDLVHLLRTTLEGEIEDLVAENIHVELPAAESHRFVSGNPTTLERMFLNLHNNAIDAIRERRAEDQEIPGHIRWQLSEQNGKIQILCRDDGAGFEPEIAGSLTAPFFTTKEPGRGTGLGLALCHSIVQRHGGSLQITSPGRGRGAEVTIFLPTTGVATPDEREAWKAPDSQPG